MASGKPSKPDVVTYGDHEVITPDTSKLRKTLRPALPGEQDPVARAEEALAAISGDFSAWMQDECERLDAARRKVREQGPVASRPARSCSSPPMTSRAIPARFGYPEVARRRRQPVPAAGAHPRSHQDPAGDRRSARRCGARHRARARARRHRRDRRGADQQAARGHRRIPGQGKPAPPGRPQDDPEPGAGAGRVVLDSRSNAIEIRRPPLVPALDLEQIMPGRLLRRDRMQLGIGAISRPTPARRRTAAPLRARLRRRSGAAA